MIVLYFFDDEMHSEIVKNVKLHGKRVDSLKELVDWFGEVREDISIVDMIMEEDLNG